MNRKAPQIVSVMEKNRYTFEVLEVTIFYTKRWKTKKLYIPIAGRLVRCAAEEFICPFSF